MMIITILLIKWIRGHLVCEIKFKHVWNKKNILLKAFLKDNPLKYLIHPLFIKKRSLIVIIHNNLMLKSLMDQNMFMTIQHVLRISSTHLQYLLNIHNLRWFFIWTKERKKFWWWWGTTSYMLDSHLITTHFEYDNILLNETLHHNMMFMSSYHFMTSHLELDDIPKNWAFPINTIFESSAPSFDEL